MPRTLEVSNYLVVLQKDVIDLHQELHLVLILQDPTGAPCWDRSFPVYGLRKPFRLVLFSLTGEIFRPLVPDHATIEGQEANRFQR